MIDVFVRCAPMSDVRMCLGGAVLAAIGAYHDVRLRPLLCESAHPSAFPPGIVGALPAEQFWNTTRRMADELSETDIYAVLDDDQMPLGPSFFGLGASILRSHLDFGMVSSVSINGEVAFAPESDPYLAEAASLGTPYFARARELEGCFPDSAIGEADIVASREITGRGMRIGFARVLRHNHLGYGYSQAVPDWSWAPGGRA